jgi:hypothetical protein
VQQKGGKLKQNFLKKILELKIKRKIFFGTIEDVMW